jgi:ribosomal protein RSM22 (predicted rRNA methylase)
MLGFRCIIQCRRQNILSRIVRSKISLPPVEGMKGIEPEDTDELTIEEIKRFIELNQANDEEDDEVLPWRVLLGPAARAGWRNSDQIPPKEWMDTQQEILRRSERTSKQRRVSNRKILESHHALQSRREQDRRREKLSRESNKQSSNVKGNDGGSIYYKPDFTFAALEYRFLPNFSITKRVLLEAKALLPDFRPKRILDFGMGVGSSSAAGIDVFDDIEWIHGVDPSSSMRDCAELILKNRGPRLTTDSMLSTKSATGNFDLVLFNFTATELPHIASTLAAAAILWEKLTPDGVLVMIEPGTPDGFSNIRSVRSMLLDCCPPELSTGQNDEEEYQTLDKCHIIAPCTHNGTCPMERYRRILRPDKINENVETENGNFYEEDDDSVESDEIDEAEWSEPENQHLGKISSTDAFDNAFCSFVHNIPGSSSTNKGDKICYLVAQKRFSESVPTSPKFPNITALLGETYRSSQNHDSINHEILLSEAESLKESFERTDEDPFGLSILVGDQNRASFGRIIRAPLKRKGHILIDYCSRGDDGQGRIVRHRLGKLGTKKIAPGQYSAARKSRWGGFWPDLIDKTHC